MCCFCCTRCKQRHDYELLRHRSQVIQRLRSHNVCGTTDFVVTLRVRVDHDPQPRVPRALVVRFVVRSAHKRRALCGSRDGRRGSSSSSGDGGVASRTIDATSRGAGSAPATPRALWNNPNVTFDAVEYVCEPSLCRPERSAACAPANVGPNTNIAQPRQHNSCALRDDACSSSRKTRHACVSALVPRRSSSRRGDTTKRCERTSVGNQKKRLFRSRRTRSKTRRRTVMMSAEAGCLF